MSAGAQDEPGKPYTEIQSRGHERFPFVERGGMTAMEVKNSEKTVKISEPASGTKRCWMPKPVML
jgi:hypothetical protein